MPGRGRLRRGHAGHADSSPSDRLIMIGIMIIIIIALIIISVIKFEYDDDYYSH